MRSPLKILYVASEVAPFAQTGSLADVAAALPRALQELGHDVRVMMPKYGMINERKYTLREVIRLKNVAVTMGGKKVAGSVKSAFVPETKVQVYFLEHPTYFGRKDLYVDPDTGEDYEDNAERFIFFCKGALETLKLLHWQPHVIHCNDWQTAPIPVLLRTSYRQEKLFAKTATLFTIHDLASQGVFGKESLPLTGFSKEMLQPDEGVEASGNVNFMKAGITHSDIITTVSEKYVQEITQSPEYGCGLERVLRARKGHLFGILNGIDDTVWNPRVDELIPRKYSASDLSGKLENKKSLVESQGLEFKENVPVISFVSTLADRTGCDLIAEAIDDLMKLKIQLVLLGTGESKYHRLFKDIAKRYPGQAGINLRFDNSLDHLIKAGSDMFLMPSRCEPCGSHQMHSLLYGTIPIVRATGGLADAVAEFDPARGTGNGFVFEQYSAKELLKAVRRALKVYADRKTWTKLVKTAMKGNFTWRTSASKYVKLYSKLEMSKRK